MAIHASAGARISASPRRSSLTVAPVFLHQAWKLPSSRFDPLGPGAFPIAICILLLVLSAPRSPVGLRGRSLGRAETSLIVGSTKRRPARRRPGLAAFVFAATSPMRGPAIRAGRLLLGDGDLSWRVAGVAMSRRTRRHVLIAVAVGVAAGVGLTLVFGGLLGLVLP